jgi:hypothetical protein
VPLLANQQSQLGVVNSLQIRQNRPVSTGEMYQQPAPGGEALAAIVGMREIAPAFMPNAGISGLFRAQTRC